MDALRYLAWGAVGMGCLLAVIALIGRRQWRAKVGRERARATGVVVDHAQRSNGARGPAVCHPVIAFMADGTQIGRAHV